MMYISIFMNYRSSQNQFYTMITLAENKNIIQKKLEGLVYIRNIRKLKRNHIILFMV